MSQQLHLRQLCHPLRCQCINGHHKAVTIVILTTICARGQVTIQREQCGLDLEALIPI